MAGTAEVGTCPCVVVLEIVQGTCHQAGLVEEIGGVGRRSCAKGAVCGGTQALQAQHIAGRTVVSVHEVLSWAGGVAGEVEPSGGIVAGSAVC